MKLPSYGDTSWVISIGLFPRNIFLVAISFLFWSMLKSHPKKDQQPICLCLFWWRIFHPSHECQNSTRSVRIIIYKKEHILIRNFQSNHHGFPPHFGCWKLLKTHLIISSHLHPCLLLRPGAGRLQVNQQRAQGGHLKGVSIDSFKRIQPTKNETWPRKYMCHWMCGCVDVIFHGTVWHFPEVSLGWLLKFQFPS